MQTTYPQPLRDALTSFGIAPTGNVQWDRGLLNTLKSKERDRLTALMGVSELVAKAEKERDKRQSNVPDLTNADTYDAHARLVQYVAEEMVLAPQRRAFEIDQNNRDVLRFLLYYFNNCPLAEDVFPRRGYKVHKNILLQGGVGAGKTLLMQIFSVYLRLIKSPRAFYNVSVTQMVNYYTIHNNLDRFTYHEEESRGFACMPENVCLNDVGLQDKTFFGMNTGLLTDEFLHARNEIWTQYGKFAHLTTNLTNEQLQKRFNSDGFGRLVDRFKTYNVIPLLGQSRR